MRRTLGERTHAGAPAGVGADTLRLRWLIAVVGVMALLTAGWPLLSMAVSNRHALAANDRLTVGPGNGQSAQFTVGPGWSVVPAQTNPRMSYSLSRGVLGMTIAYVALTGQSAPAQLWPGLREVVRVNFPGVNLGKPSAVPNAKGGKGAIGVLTGNGRHGTATVFVSKARNFAIELIVLAPRRIGSPSMIAAYQVIHSLRMLPTAAAK